LPDLKVVYVLALALLPGALGEWFYRLFVGVRWGESQWTFALRLLGFSIIGLVVYSLFGLAGAPDPAYVFPILFNTPPATPLIQLVPSMQPIAFGYFGHCVSGAAVGAGAALIVRRFSSGYPCAWDIFVRECTPEHMVAVTLENKDTYVGFVRACDVTVEKGERDLVLTEPAVYDESTKNYMALPYQHLFVRADLIYCVAVIHDPSIDTRRFAVGKSPFPGQESRQANA
jgi:hypothetical protein